MATKQLKPSTLKVYEQRLRTICNKLGITEIPEGDISEWLSLSTLENLLEGQSLSVQKAYISCVLHYTTNEYYEKVLSGKKGSDGLLARVNRLIEEEREERGYEKTPKEAEKWLEISTLKAMYERYYDLWVKNGPSRSLFITLFYLFSFHDLNYPLIRNELYTIRRGPFQKDGNNWYDGKRIYRAEHKTSNSIRGNVIKEKVPLELRGIIDQWIEHKNIKPGELLLGKANTATITQTLLKNVRVGVTMLRKIYRSYHDTEDFIAQDRRDRVMGHSSATARRHYAKQ